MNNNEIIKYIAAELDVNILENEDMKNHCYIKTGDKVRAVIYPNSVKDLIELLKILDKNNSKYKVLGRGSNMILPNKNLDIFFIKISNVLSHLNVFDDGSIDVGAGHSMQKLAKVVSKKGFSGLEFAGGIPGTVGGAIYMNAGAHTQEIKDTVEEVIFLDTDYNIKNMTRKDCKFEYRHSIFQEVKGIILSAKLKLEVKDEVQVFKKMLGNLEYRKEMQPLDKPTFGSVFKNPQGQHAGKLIEEVGLKGFKMGGAQVSTKHANFIENVENATDQDIINLINHIQKIVKKERNVELITEVEIFKEVEIE